MQEIFKLMVLTDSGWSDTGFVFTNRTEAENFMQKHTENHPLRCFKLKRDTLYELEQQSEKQTW